MIYFEEHVVKAAITHNLMARWALARPYGADAVVTIAVGAVGAVGAARMP